MRLEGFVVEFQLGVLAIQLASGDLLQLSGKPMAEELWPHGP